MSPFSQIREGEEFPVSATLFLTYLKCPQQALERIQGVYQEPTVAMFRGNLAHRIFARHLEKGAIAPEDFKMVCRGEIGTHLGQMMSGLSLSLSDVDKITREIGEYYELFITLPVEGFVGSEVDIEGLPAEGVRLRGRVDAVFREGDGVRVVDWKTGVNLGDVDKQLAYYAMVWEMEHGELPAVVEAVSLSSGERYVAEPTTDSVSQISDQVAEMIDILRAAITERGELSRTAGPYCRWCPLRGECREGDEALKIL